MKPLLKWPGGKTRELPVVRARWPARVGTYYEPFVGGGAVYFDRAPARAVLGDVNPDLADLYRRVGAGDPDLADALAALAARWDEDLPAAAAALGPLIGWYQAAGRAEGATPPAGAVAAPARRGGGPAMAAAVEKSLRQKLRRLYRLEVKHAKRFDDAELAAQLETALRAGVYTAVRAGMRATRDPAPPTAKSAAAFFFIRQYCYGSMFRENRAGRFNIPYGGKGYNAIRFGPKAAALTAPARRELLAGAEVVAGDFRETLVARRGRMKPRDLVFLDPPYDSEFSDYAGLRFGEAEQRALAEAVAALPCRVIGIMKATPLVRELYRGVAARWAAGGRELKLEEYGKTYGYNVRGRNDRGATHLVLWG